MERAETVETSRLPQFEPSFVRKIGSRPPDASNLSRTPAGVMVHPLSGRWQVKHVRPFVPRSWKNGLSVSMRPAVEKVWAAPVGFTNGSRKSCRLSPDAIQDVAGVDTGNGSDDGPRLANIGMWGLKEFDALLVTVDGVPVRVEVEAEPGDVFGDEMHPRTQPGADTEASLEIELLDAIRSVHEGHKRIPPEIASELAEHAADDALTSREMDVLRLIAAGNANKQIADKLCIEETTVKSHISSLLSKLGANDRTHAVTIGLQRGIIELDTLQK